MADNNLSGAESLDEDVVSNGAKDCWDPVRYGDAIILGGPSLPMDTWDLVGEEDLTLDQERDLISRMGEVVFALASREKERLNGLDVKAKIDNDPNC